MKKRIAAIIIAPIFGAVLGYILITMLMNGWFTSAWQRIEKPPGEGNHLVAMSQDSLWVQSATGTLYYNEHSSTCTSDCWVEVPEIPAPPVVDADQTTVTGEACAPSPPLIGATESKSECWRTYWVDHNFTFATRKDGSIFLWQADLFKDWSFVLLILGVCGGALILFIPVLLLLVILGFRDRRAKKALTGV